MIRSSLLDHLLSEYEGDFALLMLDHPDIAEGLLPLLDDPELEPDAAAMIRTLHQATQMIAAGVPVTVTVVTPSGVTRHERT